MVAVIKLNLQDLVGVLAKLELTEAKKQHILKSIGSVIIEQTEDRFKTKTDPKGNAWVSWRKGYAKKRPSGKDLLKNEGHLNTSFANLVNGNSLEVFSDESYAATHQYGDKSIITRKTKTGKTSKPFARNIPARPYLGVSAQNMADIEQEILDYFNIN